MELAGDLACSTCFQTAPVVNPRKPRPNQLETPEGRAERERLEKVRAEREAARIEKEKKRVANAITTPSGDPIYERAGTPFKTERTAQIEAISKLESAVYYGLTEHRGDEDARVVGEVLAGLAHKRGVPVEEIRAEWVDKVIKKTKMQPNRVMAETRMGSLFEAGDRYLAEKASLAAAIDAAGSQGAHDEATAAYEVFIGQRRAPGRRF
ncbi:hypothetical protein ACFVAJ_16680 [Agromyces sp. NPDC057679]|uniref:hypothetical protein n=1 Tax=Agromyces sp. NPDC057679 TaxID=3346207 RepID=UPI0036709A6D